MRKIGVLIASFFLGASVQVSADTKKADAQPKIEESTSDADKAAVSDASSDADKWAAKAKVVPPPVVEEAAPGQVAAGDQYGQPLHPQGVGAQEPPPPATPPPTQPEAAAPAATANAVPPAPSPEVKQTPPPKPFVPHPGLNQMKGKMLSKSYDPNSIRLTVDGGYNVEFSFDSKTTVVNGGSPIGIDDLNYNDELVIGYSGKDLYAIEIERTSKAPRPE